MQLDATIIVNDWAKLDPQAQAAALDAVMARTAAKMANRAKGKAPKFTSALAASINVQRVAYGQEWRVVAGQRYAAGLEWGGGHKGEPLTRARLEALKAWVKGKGLQSDPIAIARAAWNIGRKIEDKGVNPQPFFTPAFEETVPEVLPDLMQTISEALKP